MKIFSFSGKGRKKSSVAKVKIFKGNGKIIIIKNLTTRYFYNIYKIIINFLSKKFDIKIYVKGGGEISKIKSIEYALTNVLLKIKPNYKKIIKEMNLISDSRKNERKKIGFVKSRKKKQFSKR
ncbi:SSU ribosomal protein S9p (S16e) [Candidatus Vidania fulgoroideae]|uniref:Small ribosomal subunit protein uS9 n=1 Tax=Candidatus Vidania fulgoroideorum TaxID=881286 RepID=A0A346E0C1_9PROT|nr:SSU ribosomal protein S9p (S16e) [Candidatus Vidania fulgoroideae]WDI79371.1 30S ribosomal protein S9 [Candidatus Vidania fulgoroideae]WDR79276.1 30S ribosomal protein S9 [Candidatus Vidania fulgoroideae]